MRVAGIEQVVDEFLESRLLGQSTSAAGASARHELLDAVQRLFPVGTASVGGALQEFFAAANELATHPQDLAVRNELLERAGDLAGQLRDAAAGLAAIQREADQRVATVTGDANRLLERVAELNRGIMTSEGGGRQRQRAARPAPAGARRARRSCSASARSTRTTAASTWSRAAA